MPLSAEHRSTLFETLQPICGTPAVEALLSQFPADAGDAPVTREYLDARLADLRTELRGEITGLGSELRGESADLRTELRAEIVDLRTELRAEIVDFRTELHGEIVDLRTELRGEITDFRVDVAQQLATLQRTLLTWMIGILLSGIATAYALGQASS